MEISENWKIFEVRYLRNYGSYRDKINIQNEALVMNFWLVNMCWPLSQQVLTKSYIRDSLEKSRFSMAWLQNLMRSRICVYLMFQWLKTILIWCISKTLRLLIDYQTSIGFSQKSKFCYFLQISLPNSLRICLQNKPKL